MTDKKTLAKLFPIIDEAIENAIGIESYKNRYYYDERTIYFHTLLSGYIDGDYFVPIRFGIKENNQSENKLYVMLGQNKIDLRVLKLPAQINERNNSRLRSIISISEIFKNVNSNDRNFLKYIPNQFLCDEQIKAKRLALREDDIKYGRVKDGKYSFGRGVFRQWKTKITSLLCSNILFPIRIPKTNAPRKTECVYSLRRLAAGGE